MMPKRETISLNPESFTEPTPRELAWARYDAVIDELDARGLGDAIGYIPRPSRRRDDAPTPTDISKLPPLLTIAQAADVMGKTVRAVEAMVYRNEIPTVRVGKRGRRVKRDELLKALGLRGRR